MELKKLSNDELLLKTKNLVSQERGLLLEILLHLKEINSRKLFLEIGYSSLWAYCTEGLHYSEASAQRRIEAMRALRDLPVLAEKIESGALSLSNIARAQSVMRKAQASEPEKKFAPEEKLELFAELENKSQRLADVILAGRFPEEIKKLESVRQLNADFSEIKLAVSADVLAKLNRVKELLSHKKPNPTLAETIEMMADFVIAKKDLAKSAHPIRTPPKNSTPQRRRKNQIQQNLSTEETRYLPIAIPIAIPIAKRREVWRNAEGSCQYLDIISGRRCGGRHQLEIEHVKPKSFGGGDDIKNLKLFCRAHNLQAAKNANLI